MSVELLLSAQSKTPMYAQIVEQIASKVIAREWQAGYPLPSIRELASASQVSVITVKRAYLELERAGIIVTRQGKGSFVADAPDVHRALALDEFRSQLAGLLQAAKTLGLSREDVVGHIEDAFSGLPATSDSPTAATKGKST